MKKKYEWSFPLVTTSIPARLLQLVIDRSIGEDQRASGSKLDHRTSSRLKHRNDRIGCNPGRWLWPTPASDQNAGFLLSVGAQNRQQTIVLHRNNIDRYTAAVCSLSLRMDAKLLWRGAFSGSLTLGIFDMCGCWTAVELRGPMYK